MLHICTRGDARRAVPSLVLGLTLLAAIITAARSQPEPFITRSHDTLRLGDRPFFFLGANAYYLLEQAARGDTHTVINLFQTARRLNMTVVRTWAFYDSSDSLNPAVIQYRPGRFNEHALRSLDYVLLQARRHNIRLLLPLVNSWDDYGGMNQYVRWRLETLPSTSFEAPRYQAHDLERTISGDQGRSYRYAISTAMGHDDFYADFLIRQWFKGYIAAVLERRNVFTGIAYRDDPFVFGWEVANEPRSSDRSGNLVRTWIAEISAYIKSVDPNHLVGTGEEGFDISPAGYTLATYNNQQWLFDGSAGITFSGNSVIPTIDFGSCHLYPEVWHLSNSAGGVWIRDHIRVARGAGKPLVVGEFGVREYQTATYESWLTTALYDNAAGAMVWQILEGPRTDREGYGFRCSELEQLCLRLGEAGEQFIAKSNSGTLPRPQTFRLLQNYPNPFNGLTTIAYSLSADVFVNLSIWTALGEHVATVVEGYQSAGERKELFDGRMCASGAYFCRLTVEQVPGAGRASFRQTRKLLLLR